MMMDLDQRLSRLGDALEEAAAADLASAAAGASPVGRRLPRRAVAMAAALALAVPAVAIGASQLIDAHDVADSLPRGTFSLAGSAPDCTVVRENVEYRCTLGRAPAPEVADWKGTVEPTVDRTKHVNGGCRSLASDGRTWACYIGREAVAEHIIAPGMLGDYAPVPGRG